MTRHSLTTGPTRRTVLMGFGAGLTVMAMPGALRAQSGPTVLRFGLSTFPPSIKPWDNTGAAANTVKLMLNRGLTGYNNASELVPELAESWDWESDTSIVFKLKPGARFHNGEQVTSGDVKWSLEKILEPGSSSFLRRDLSMINGIEVIDDLTLRVTLSSPSAVMLDLFANFNCPVIWSGSQGEDYIGCGPFKMKSQERGVYIELERNDDFVEAGTPKVEGIRFIVYADENLRYAALEAGDVDIIEYLPWSQFDTVDASDKLKMAASLGPYMFLLFNVTQGPFADPRVRRAVGFAIERQDIVDAAFAGRGEPLFSFPNPQGSPFDLSDPEHEWSYDPDRAKALLAEAGYPNGFDCRLLATATYGMHQDTASVVQAYLAMIGINATLDLPDWATRVTAGTEGRYDLCVHGTSGYYNDPDSIASLLHSANPSYLQSFGFKSDRIDSLLDQGRAETDPDKRKAIYQELNTVYFEEVPQVPLNWRVQAYAMSNRIQGFASFPGFLNGASTYSLDETTLG